MTLGDLWDELQTLDWSDRDHAEYLAAMAHSESLGDKGRMLWAAFDAHHEAIRERLRIVPLLPPRPCDACERGLSTGWLHRPGCGHRETHPVPEEERATPLDEERESWRREVLERRERGEIP